MKKIWTVLLLLVLCLGLCSACTPQEEPSTAVSKASFPDKGIVYESESVVVKVNEEPGQKIIQPGPWEKPLTDEMIYQDSPVIFTGHVRRAVPIHVEYKFGEETREIPHWTLAEIEVVKILSDKRNLLSPEKKTVAVKFATSLSNTLEVSPVIREGQDLLLRCIPPTDYTSDTMELSQWLDLVSWGPTDFPMERVGNCYLTSAYFLHYFPESKSLWELTEMEDSLFYKLKQIPLDNFREDHAYVAEACQKAENTTAVYEALRALKYRSDSFGGIIKSSYLIPCDQLEQEISERASKF